MDADSGEETSVQQRLYVEFDIRFSASSPCPLSDVDKQTRDVRQQVVGDMCQTDVEIDPVDCSCDDEDCTEVVHLSQAVDTVCLCPVFGEYDCIPRIVDVSDEGVAVETYLPNRERLPDLVESLKRVTEGLSLRRLKRIGDVEERPEQESVTLELDPLTEKQRDAVATAVAAGYYETPRATSLGELSEEMGLSKPALSERLSAVESKLATAAFRR
ncbi:MAG: helix-turn-helix domain-containing protein [Halovenus sp.]